MVSDRPVVRRAREDDARAVAELLYLTAPDMYDRVAGGRDRALRVIAADLGARDGGTWVAELEGEIAGAMVAFPYGDAPGRTRAFVRAAIRETPPSRWPSLLRLMWKGHRRAPRHAPDWLYVDALATVPELRRRGVATALLAHAERIALDAGRPALALDTPETNTAALALYESVGFEVAETLPTTPPVPAAVVLVKRLRG
jgi:ribosomal protein S18 acetylase RimI-like enzyme